MNNASTTCSRCGKSVPSESRFCLECGSDLTGVSGADGSNPTQQAATKIDRRAASEQALFETLRQATLGEYDIITEVGRGGMANVYLAHDIALDRKVAIKVISPELLRMGEGVVERFQREARTAASLSHPHIIPIYSVKESDRILFFVMKFVEGRTLESVVREEGQLPVAMVQTILNQVGSALDYAHRRGVIHRDIKPGNIMLDEGGWAVVTDFGIAKVTEADGLTMTGATVGTPTYMSPEQCAGQPLTGAVDQYALGVVAYEMLTGRLPFEGDSAMTVMYKHTHEPPPSIQAVWPDCPRPLGSAVMRMLAKDPDDRFPSMESAIEAIGVADRDDTIRTRLVSLAKSGGNQALLEKFQTPKSSIPRPNAFKTRGTPTNISSPIIDDSGSQQRSQPDLTAPPQRSRSKLIWGVPALVGVLGGLAWVIISQTGSSSEPTQPADPTPPVVTQTGPVVSELTVEPAQLSLDLGEQRKLTPIAYDSSGAVLDDVTVVFSSTDRNIADVSDDGTITALSGGDVLVTARLGTHTVTIGVSVTAPPEPVASTTRPRPTVANVRLTPDQPAPGQVGDVINLRATAFDGNGNTMSGQTVSWRSSNNNVASVDRAGVVSLNAEGSAVIIAQVGAYPDTVEITVQPVPVANIQVTLATSTLEVGQSTTATARPTDANGNPLNRQVTWSSSDPNVATVNSSGRVEARGSGPATIIAAFDDTQGNAGITVQTTVPVQTEPPPPDAATDRRAIEAVIEQYRLALQREDLPGLRAVFPGMPESRAQSLTTFFGVVDNLQVETTVGDIQLQGDQASLRVEFHYSFRASGNNTNQDDPQQLTMRRDPTGWVIAAIR